MGYGAMQLAGPGVFGPPKDRHAALAVPREEVDLLERVPVDQARDPLTRRQLAFRVLAPERLGVPMACLVFAPAQVVERIDLARFLAQRLAMNIQRWPSTSSAR